MDEKLHFIQPCCVNSKLPIGIDQARGIFSFYTHCDVPMEKFHRAISYKVGEPHVMVLTMVNITKETLQYLEQCFERNWISDLILSTASDKTSLVSKYFLAYQSHVRYAVSESTVTHATSHMVLYNDDKALTLAGPMYNVAGTDALAAYTVMVHNHYGLFTSKECGNPLLNILLPDVMRHRQACLPNDRSSYSVRIQKFLNYTFPPYKV